MSGHLSKWDHRFLTMSKLVASWSKDPSTKVGAVIVDNRKRVVSLGFNGFPRGVSDEHVHRDRKLMRTLHAEENALLFAQRDLDGCTLYVTHHPCSRCAAKLIQVGIVRVVVSQPMHNGWAVDTEEASYLFNEAGVEVVSEVQALAEEAPVSV